MDRSETRRHDFIRSDVSFVRRFVVLLGSSTMPGGPSSLTFFVGFIIIITLSLAWNSEYKQK